MRFSSAAMDFANIPPFETPEVCNIIIDTSKWSQHKFSWREGRQVFELSGVLPTRAQFPYDFGFIPQTEGGDGDSLDVLFVMDEPGFVGCLVKVRLLGVIEAKQTEKDKTCRNDRLIGVAVNSRTEGTLRKLTDLNKTLVDEIEHFFVSYNDAKEKRFSPERARQLVRASLNGCGAGKKR